MVSGSFERALRLRPGGSDEMGEVPHTLRVREIAFPRRLLARVPVGMILPRGLFQINATHLLRALHGCLEKQVVSGIRLFVRNCKHERGECGPESIRRSISHIVLCECTDREESPAFVGEAVRAVTAEFDEGLVAKGIHPGDQKSYLGSKNYFWGDPKNLFLIKNQLTLKP